MLKRNTVGFLLVQMLVVDGVLGPGNVPRSRRSIGLQH